ncbi:MAG: FtsX-like permease family protein [Treponema sp.]
MKQHSTLHWIFFVLRRFNAADTKGRSAITGVFSMLGIAFGVTALIVILSVMNGFQRSFIDTILQISSAHIRLEGSEDQIACAQQQAGIDAFYRFAEAQTLIQGNYGRQYPALLRAVPASILTDDAGFARTIHLKEGRFALETPASIVLGYELAKNLSVGTGNTISILALAGTANTDIFPENTELIITGLIKTGYYAIDSSFAFISNHTYQHLCGVSDTVSALVKLKNPEYDRSYLAALQKAVPGIKAESWRTYNHAFFGALRVEKNTMFMLVFLIFIVVTVNIYNGMRRSIYERREEISVLVSIGAHKRHVQLLFIANGLSIGLIGAVLGLILGLLLSADINGVFIAAEYTVNTCIELITLVLQQTNPDHFAIFSPQYFYIDKVPVRIFFGEVFTVFVFGVLSAASAAWIAAKKILTLQPAEVLRYE